MTKLYYFLFIGIFSVLFSCKDENKFVLEENTADIEQIITAVIEQDSINILKNNEKNIYVIKHFIKNRVFTKSDDESAIHFVGKLNDMINPPFQENKVKFGFDEKDSLYLLSQNKVSDTIRLPESILENSNVLKENELKNWNWQKQYDSYYRFDFPIISKDKTKAYLEVGYICGGLCEGGGMAYFLQKQNGKWVVVNKRATWIS